MDGNGTGERILVMAPIGKDARLTCQVLYQSGLTSHPCGSMEELCREIDRGVGAILLTEEALETRSTPRLLKALSQQPSWSEIPLIVLTPGRGAKSRVVALRALEPLGNVTFLERPLRSMTLVSTLQMSLRARRRQYEIFELLGRLEDGMRQRDDFLAMLAHELRNPLAPIRNAVELLRSNQQLDADSMRWATNLLDRQSQQLTRMVDDLLDVSRITRGKITLHWETADLSTVVERAVETSRPLVEFRRHQLSVGLPTEQLLVRADVVRLAQAITNLLNNAAKYTEPGGRIELRAYRLDDQACVQVKDSGVGMTRELLARIFEPFSQGARTTDVVHAGLGLGLAVARSLMELHSGKVYATSDGPGTGSCFTLELPLADPNSGIESADDDATQRHQSQRVLVVEDNRDAADSLAMLLRLAGHQVRVVYDGPSALRENEQFRPNAVLLDIGLPGMNGYEVATCLREAGHEQLRLIALSGYGQEQDKRRSAAAGFHAHLVKPVRLEMVQQALDGAS